ncbi:MAG: NAD-dependent epimerase/dehydratase family protein [Cyclobacteriaceae bacterium]|jgi:nucleoside-diphosphate-sugar epimerase
MEKVLVIGAGGQLGRELVAALRSKYGQEQVIASDIKPWEDSHLDAPYVKLNAMDEKALFEVVNSHEITEIYHLAAILSAKGEMDPLFAWDLNMKSLLNILELGKEHVKKVFWPSSIAVFGPDTPKDQTPQHTLMNPTTVYGISKLAGERWCEYYHQHYGVDVRSLRYPGLIGYKTLPGGGTTDYAVDIYYKAVQQEKFDCFLSENMKLPMMYMDDAVKATLDLMMADAEKLSVRSSYNINAISFSPREIYESIRKHYSNFEVSYTPDYREKIADSWPNSIDDTVARTDWGWKPAFDLEEMSDEIIWHLTDMLESVKSSNEMQRNSDS